MAGFLEGLKGIVRGGAQTFREKTYPTMRNTIAEALLQPGGGGTHESAKDAFHRRGSKAMTEALGAVLPPQVAANLADTAYMGNEALTGVLASMAGKPYFSDYGFRWKDIGINRQGQDEGVKELDKRWTGVRAEEPVRRYLYRGVE